MTTATTKGNTIYINGYFNDSAIVITEHKTSVNFDYNVTIDERELSNVVQVLRDTVDANGVSHADFCKKVEGGVTLDFSTKLDIADIESDLRIHDEAKINVTGDSQDHITKLVSEIRSNIKSVSDIFVDIEESSKGYQSTYIRVYA